jgi:hypothetical protein
LKRWVGPRVQVDTLTSGEGHILRSRGLVTSGLPEVEIADCPPRLREVAANLVSSVAANGASEPESLKVGKLIGARFVSPKQPLVETFRLIKSCADPHVLRIVDREENFTAFPHRLIATHLCATADKNRSEALRLLLVSVEVWGQENAASNAALGDFEVNPNNFWSWVDLGTALADAQELDEAILHWKIAACVWPRGGKLYANRMLERSRSRPAWNSKEKAVLAFWQSVSNDSIKAWCAELRVGLTDLELTD